MMVTAGRFRPKMPTMSGVIATRGTERSTIASGMKTELAVRDWLKAMAQVMAATVPATRPSSASRSVVPDSASSSCRLAAADESVNRYRQTSTGPLPMNGEMLKTFRNRTQAPRMTARVTRADRTRRVVLSATERAVRPLAAACRSSGSVPAGSRTVMRLSSSTG
jgi:hypothetical protein